MNEDPRSPDHSTCRHCGHPISFDDLGYTHDDSGFGECGILVNELTGEIAKVAAVETSAEPIEWEGIVCERGHPTRPPSVGERLLPCGCVFEAATDEALRDAGVERE